MKRPMRIWWARPRKLCALERPGGGGRSHRPERRAAEIAYLRERGVWLVVSTMTSRHNLDDYEAAGLEWRHVPVVSCAEGAMIDAYVVTDRPDEVAAAMRERGWTAE